MAVPRNHFKTVRHFSDTLLMNRLEYNLKSWFDWCFLKIGAWGNVVPPTLGQGTSNLAVLREVNDPSYTTRTVFETARKEWVWESDIDYVAKDSNTYDPISPALIYVDGIATAPDFINYPLGRVVFSSVIPSSAVVTASYSYRNVQISIADDTPWWNELQFQSYKQDDPQFSRTEDGSWSIGSHHRIQMPCVVIEAVPRAVSTPYQLGDGSAWVSQDVLVHILAESRRQRNDLVDKFRGQFDNSFSLFDNDLIAVAQDYPLDYQGDIIDSSINYGHLVDPSNGYVWQNARIIRTEVAEVEPISSRLFEGIVRMTFEFILED